MNTQTNSSLPRRTASQTLPVRLIRSEFDGYVFSVCLPGSWRPLSVSQTLNDAQTSADLT